MDYRSFIKKLENDGIVYIYDDCKGREEREIPQSEPIVLDIMMGGKEVNKNFYDNY